MAHGAHITMLLCDWPSIKDQLKAKSGRAMPDEVTPAPAYFQALQECLADSMMEAETLSKVVRLEEADKQDALKLDTSKQYGIHLDSRHSHDQAQPRGPDAWGHRKSETHWLLAQIRQPGRLTYCDLDENRKFADKFTDKTNFRLCKDMAEE